MAPTMDSAVTGEPRYRRSERCVFRVLADRGWIGGPGRSTIGISGAALFVWMVLDVEATAAEVASEIRATWPELGEVPTAMVHEALDLLIEHGVVETTGDTRAGSTAR